MHSEDGERGQLVVVREVRFRSMCEHHLLPFIGVAHLAYAPGEQLIGLGTLSRVLDAVASRPQLQERLGEQVAAAVPRGSTPRACSSCSTPGTSASPRGANGSRGRRR